MIMFPLLFGVDDLIAYGIIAALGSVVSSVYTNRQNKEINKDNQEWQEKMVDKQNEYNDPSNQVDRLQKAGINPIAGTMSSGLSVSGNTSASPGTPSSFPMQDLMSAVTGNSNLLASAYKASEEGISKKALRPFEVDLASSNAQFYLANVQKLGVDTKGQMIANEYASAMYEVSLMQGRANADLTYEQISNLKALTGKYVFELEQVLPASVQESLSRTHLNVWQQDKVVAEIERMFYEENEMKAHTDLMVEQTNTERATQDVLSGQSDIQSKESESLSQQIQLFYDTYDSQVERIANETKLSKKQVRWYIVNSILGSGQSVATTAAAGIGAAKLAGSLGKAATVVGF